jgi:hypothetical protein
MPKPSSKRNVYFVIAAIILLVFFFYKRQGSKNRADAEGDTFSRSYNQLIYTKHARCRMDCRHIDEQEVQEILEKGRVNHRKSEPAARPDPKYALEGTTRDGQEVRIVFAPSRGNMVVITVIDLGKEWTCHCN